MNTFARRLALTALLSSAIFAARADDHAPARADFNTSAADTWVGVQDLYFAGSGGVGLGESLRFYAAAGNDGPDTASAVGLGFAFDAELPDLVVTQEGWSCDAPLVNAGTTTVACSLASLPFNGGGDFRFEAAVPPGEYAVTLAAAISSDAQDPYPADNSSSDVLAITSDADLSVSIARAANTATQAVYVITVGNAGPDPVSSVELKIKSNLINQANFSWLTPQDPRWLCTSVYGFYRTEWMCWLDALLPHGESSDFRINVPLSKHKSGYNIEAELKTRFDPDPRNNMARKRLAMP